MWTFPLGYAFGIIGISFYRFMRHFQELFKCIWQVIVNGELVPLAKTIALFALIFHYICLEITLNIENVFSFY